MAAAAVEAPTSKVPELTDEEKKRKRQVGHIRLKMYYDVQEASLVVECIEARDLRTVEPGKCDPYVKIYLMPDPNKKTKKKSKVKKHTVNPIWDEKISWPMPNFEENSDRMVQVSVWDNAGMAKHDFLGRMSVKVSVISPPNEGLDGWFELFDPERGKFDYNFIVPPEVASPFVALYDHIAGCDKELYIRTGDELEVIKKADDWSLVQNTITKARGFVPTNFIASARSLEKEVWFFGKIARAKAEKLLLNPMVKHGGFLIRESESQPGQYSLSMKDGDGVRHFRIISETENSFKLQGSPTTPFGTLAELVEYHSKKKAGLTTTLKDPCPKEQQAKASDLSYEQKDKWEVPRESIELVGVLGNGQYGEVYKGTWKGTTPVAVKTLKSQSTTVTDFLAEAAIMKNLKHPNLVQLYAVCTVGEPIYIITELMSHGNLLDYLQTPAGESLRLPALLDMASGIASGMAYLEAKNYIHRDLAARNILVGENNVCKVADFGFARMVQGDAYKPENLEKFPVRWTAPEAMANNTYSIKSDVWSFGILLTELVTYGKKPYQGLNNKEVVQKLETGYRMPCPAGCPDALYDIMNNCWKKNASDRPTFSSLVFQLQDFFYGGEHNYAEVSKLVD